MTCCFREDTGPAEAERLWKQLKHDVCSSKSLLAKHFTKDVLKELKSVKTTYGGTLVHQIKAGVLHPELEIGLYASDQDAYTAFAPLYDPIIKDYYGVQSLEHPETTYGTHEELAVLEEVDPNCKYIQKVQLELRRNLEGYPFASIINKDKRELIEKMIKQMCTHLWCGRYVSMLRLHEDMYEFLAKADLVMKDDNKYLRTAGAYRMYPFQRGIWGTCVPWCFNPTFVYVNHEDHLRLFSIEYNNKLIECYKRMVSEIVALRLQHFFAKRKGLGYLTFCPSNIGTAMKVTIRLKLPNLSKEPNFEEICESNDLLVSKVASSQETTTEPEDVLYELTNKRKFGLTEIDLIRQVRNGLEKIVEEEKKLDGKK